MTSFTIVSRRTGFLPVVLFGNFILQKNILFQNSFLILASLLFYGWLEPKLVFLISGSIVINYCTAIGMAYIKNEKVRLLFLLGSIAFNIGVLSYFKYAGWCCAMLGKVLKRDFGVVSTALPLGISFYTFQALSYVVDVYKGAVKAQKNFLTVVLYILMFPQLVAGPIVRYSEIEAQIQSPRRLFAEDFSIGVERFIRGFAKKVLLADSFAVMADKAFSLNTQGTLGWAMAWLGAAAYALQIYYDFSGYSDMAIGLGKMLGFRYPENFDYPYFADSLTDFWHRWHMSLSVWFRDYVYIPLGGNRKGRTRAVINQAATWLATGLWHGANFTFLIWGGINGLWLMLEKILKIPTKIKGKRTFGMLYRLYTVIFIILCWVVFRAENVGAAPRYLGAMTNFRMAWEDAAAAMLYLRVYRVELFLGLLFCTPIVPGLVNARPKMIKPLHDMAMLILFAVSISYVIKGTYSPFIYFNF